MPKKSKVKRSTQKRKLKKKKSKPKRISLKQLFKVKRPIQKRNLKKKSKPKRISLKQLFKVKNKASNKDYYRYVLESIAENNASTNDYNRYLKEQNDRQQKEYLNQMLTLQRQSVMSADPYNISIFSSYLKNLKRNTRIFFIGGHSSIKSVKRTTQLANYNNMRYLSVQSAGRLGNPVFEKIITDVMKQNEEFHKSFVSAETDGDAKNLNFLMLRYLNPDIYDYWKKIYKTNNITDFRIYPKPNNPELEQNPPDRTYYFYPTTRSVHQTMGVYEITSLNKEGNYIIDDFMLSEELYIYFTLQFLRANTLHLQILANMRIPDLETMYYIITRKTEEYLLKLNEFNKLNREIYSETYLHSVNNTKDLFTINNALMFIDNNKFDLKSKIEIALDNYSKVKNITRDEPIYNIKKIGNHLTTVLGAINAYYNNDDILIIDNGCFGIADLPTFIPNQGYLYNQVHYYPEVKKKRPKRSKSANLQNNLNIEKKIEVVN